MDELQDVLKQHAMIMKATTALFYGILVSIAMNFFWEPGHIYSSGITGLAQLIGTLTKNGPVHLSTALMLFVLNIPLFVLGGGRLVTGLRCSRFWQFFAHRS